MSQKPIRTFDEFWPHYVRAHASKQNRMLHFAGTSAAMAIVAAAVLGRRPRLLALAPLVGYGAAWIGHQIHAEADLDVDERLPDLVGD